MNAVAMADMRVDRQILAEHLVVEATVDTAARLSTLKYSSWCFLEATTSAFYWFILCNVNMQSDVQLIVWSNNYYIS